MQRYFYNEMLANEQFILPKDIYKHAITVMRMRVGDKFELVQLINTRLELRSLKLLAIKLNCQL